MDLLFYTVIDGVKYVQLEHCMDLRNEYVKTKKELIDAKRLIKNLLNGDNLRCQIETSLSQMTELLNEWGTDYRDQD